MNKIFIKIISIKDVLLIESPDLPACGDAFSFRAEGRELDLCDARYELSEELPSFKRGDFIFFPRQAPPLGTSRSS
ncbi:MAG: hypothetical protein JZD41_05255 [Thermoproteus sp.]|nr:hypothetical protein [Thermoproteus sp.]